MAADGMERCIGEVMAAHGDGSTREDALAMLSLVDERAERLGREQGLSPQQAAAQAAKELSDAEAAAAAVETRNRLLNLRTRMARQSLIDQAAADSGRNGEPDLVHAMLNRIVPKNTPTDSNRFAAETVMATRRVQYGMYKGILAKAGLSGAYANGTLARDWARELYELSMRSAGKEDRVGFTKNEAAMKIAETIHGFQQMAKQRLNRAGAWIGDYAGYITKTTHDADKIRRAGFDDWRRFIEPRLSAGTFEGVQNRGRFLNEVWKSLVDGVHLSDRGQVGMKDAAFTGPSNMAKRLSQSRVLHFNNADAWLDYQERFGTGNLVDQIDGAFARAARQEALMRQWGTNPEAEFAADFQRLEERYHDSYPEAVAKLRQQRRAIQARFDNITGEASRPVNKTLADIMNGTRAVISMSKLGAVPFTHLSSFVTKAALLRHYGVGWLEAYSNSVQSLLGGRSAGGTRELAEAMGIGMDGAHGAMLSPFSVSEDGVPGTMSKLTNQYFRAAGLTYELDAQKQGVARILASYYGKSVGKSFEELTPELQQGLRSYGMDANDWEALRTAPGHLTLNGVTYLTPDAATRAGLSPEQADTLALKLHSLYSDEANNAVVAPGIDEKARLLFGTHPGTIPGEMARAVMQFKTWGCALIRQVIGRMIYGSPKFDTAGMFGLALGSAAVGYVVMALKDAVQGKTPRDPLSFSTVGAAMMQGGGFGILGDFLFGQTSRFGQSLAETFAGPSFGMVSDIKRIFDTATSTEPDVHNKDAIPETARFIQSNIPFLNIWYVRHALDYLLFNSLQETLNPGYLRRAERSLQKRTGQTYFLSPQNHLRTFGR